MSVTDDAIIDGGAPDWPTKPGLHCTTKRRSKRVQDKHYYVDLDDDRSLDNLIDSLTRSNINSTRRIKKQKAVLTKTQKAINKLKVMFNKDSSLLILFKMKNNYEPDDIKQLTKDLTYHIKLNYQLNREHELIKQFYIGDINLDLFFNEQNRKYFGKDTPLPDYEILAKVNAILVKQNISNTLMTQDETEEGISTLLPTAAAGTKEYIDAYKAYTDNIRQEAVSSLIAFYNDDNNVVYEPEFDEEVCDDMCDGGGAKQTYVSTNSKCKCKDGKVRTVYNRKLKSGKLSKTEYVKTKGKYVAVANIKMK